VLCVSLLQCVPAHAQPVRATTTTLRFVDARLSDVIGALGQLLGLTVIASDVPDVRVSLGTAAPVRSGEVAQVLEALLESHGLVLVRNGSIAQVGPADKAPAPSAISTGFDLGTSTPVGLVSHLVTLQHIRADEGVAALKPVSSATARIEAVSRSNSILMTDRGVNVARYLTLLRTLDASAQGEDGLRTYVIALKYASADEMAGVLGQLYGVATGAQGRSASLDDQSLSRSLSTFRQRDADAFRVRNERVPDAAPVSAPRDSSRARGSLVGQTTVVASATENALVLRTAPGNIGLLRETIDSLDRRPVQVLLEVTVAEVVLGRGLEYGVDWSAAGRDGGVQFGDPARATPDTSSFSTADAVRDAVVRATRLGNIDVRAVLRALASTSKVNVLSTPEVLATNNREARILVGSKFPFIASQRFDIGVDRAVQYENVGTQLTIIPTVNSDGYVTVQLLQEVSTVTNQVVQPAFNAPVISTREAATRATVRDGQTMVIGGLIGTSTEVSNSGVPFLKDIPLLGYLFRRESRTTQRTELAIFVTPYVIRTDADADALFDRARERTGNPAPGDARGVTRPPRVPPQER
jgi:general secretion pathway protein D